MTLILGLETSCDETAAAVVRDGAAVLSNAVATQPELHLRYAGVGPEIASRAHLERLMPVIAEALDAAGTKLTEVDAIAVGNRPGLIGSLIVGVGAAKALAWSLGKPLIGVDHVRAHLHAAHLTSAPSQPPTTDDPPQPQTSRLKPQGSNLKAQTYPALGLVVSGGHTTLYRMDSPADLTVLGRTIDDAIGEAYDKAGVILDAGYPGGPAVDKLAQTAPGSSPEHSSETPPGATAKIARVKNQAMTVPQLPISMLSPTSLDFSFSGLKTALLYAVRGHPVGRGKSATFERDASDLTAEHQANLAAAFQHAAIEAVIRKLGRAIKQLTEQNTSPRRIVLGGGVSANSLLRTRVLELGQQHSLPVHLPEHVYCVDNAAMIAGYAYERLERGETSPLDLPVVATSRV